MNRSHTFAVTLATLAAAALIAGPASSQTKASDHASHHASHHAASPASADANQAHSADGEVRRIDREAGRVTLRHGDIKTLDMPPMTMVFTVRDKALLEGFKTGDKVKFKVVNEAGKLVITEMQALR